MPIVTATTVAHRQDTIGAGRWSAKQMASP